jgi:hypothetical protein
MNRRSMVLTILLILVVMITPIMTTLALSEAGRQANVAASLAACYRSGPRNVAAINFVRSDAIGNHLVATDPSQSPRTRRARGDEVQKDARYALVLDAQTDQSLWRDLDNPIDRRAVRDGTAGKKPFHCATAFPPAQFIP